MAKPLNHSIAESVEPGFLQIHHLPQKYFLYRSYSSATWVDELKCWCVFDAGTIEAMFRSHAFSVVNYAEHCADIARRIGLDLEPMVRALAHIPLAQEGARHAELRKEMALLIAAQTGALEGTLRQELEVLVETACRPGRMVDLVEHVAIPIYDRVFARILGVALGDERSAGSVSQIFDRSLSLNRRKRVNAQIADLAASYAAERERLTTTPELAVALTILGRDALIGSIAMSLWHILAQGDGAPLRDLAFPEDLPCTGIPYLERVATQDFRNEHLAVRPGERVRLYIDATAPAAGTGNADLLFGKGRHLCLGKPLARQTWRALALAMAKVPFGYRLHALRLRSNDYVFTYPEQAVIEFHE